MPPHRLAPHHPPDGPAAAPVLARGRLLSAYAGLCLLAWLLYGMAGTEGQRGAWRWWEAAYDASWALWPPMLLGLGVLPWVAWLQRRAPQLASRLVLHVPAALLFAALWQALDYAAAWALFGADHASATLVQRLLWRGCWGVLVYGALVLGFAGALHARRAQHSLLQVAQAEAARAHAEAARAQADAARVRAELAAISGKLNPHFLFNTLNAVVMLTRTDPAAAELALHRFSQMMRYVLDSQRGAAERVALADELDFVRDYLALEALRFGPRLRVDLQIDPATLDEPIPPLTLQPLVENCLLHGLAPQPEGGTVRIAARRQQQPAGLRLQVADDGAGCVWPAPAAGAVVAAAAPGPRRAGGIGLGALRRRFELDYAGQATLDVRSAPGQGFQVEIFIPFAKAAA